jgi:NADPH-dependent 2,4-dienoyl-CoA reductase/sulfur reductase-like enzyme
MSRILVIGGGVIGLSIAMMAARQGHSVTILEHDSDPLPASTEEAWRFRVANEIRSLLALPQEVIGRPGLVDCMMEVANTHEAVTTPGPSRKELLEMLA